VREGSPGEIPDSLLKEKALEGLNTTRVLDLHGLRFILFRQFKGIKAL
jgi:hypothetical protein